MYSALNHGHCLPTDHDYPVNTTKWNDLSEYQRQAIWELNYYGYSYPGHQTERYYAATQLLIWEVVDRWYDPYYPDGVTPIDLSPEINEINHLRSQPQGRPQQPDRQDGNQYSCYLDRYQRNPGQLQNVNSGNGINASVSGNNLAVSITSENYDGAYYLLKKEFSKGCSCHLWSRRRSESHLHGFKKRPYAKFQAELRTSLCRY